MKTIGLIGTPYNEAIRLNNQQRELPEEERVWYVAINYSRDMRGYLFDEIIGSVSDIELNDSIQSMVPHYLKKI